MAVSVGAEPAQAKATPVSRERFVMPAGHCGAWPGFNPTHRATRQHTRHHWCGGRRRVRRARAGFEIDHSEPSGSRVAISRAAGPDGARNTSEAASNKLNREFRLHRRCGGRRRERVSRQTQGQAAAPVGGGGADDAPRHRRCGGRRRARLRHPWAVAGPGRASRRRAERSSRRGRRAGGPPPTGAQSSPAQQGNSTAGNQAISDSRAPSGSPTWQQHPPGRAGARNRRRRARGPRPRR